MITYAECRHAGQEIAKLAQVLERTLFRLLHRRTGQSLPAVQQMQRNAQKRWRNPPLLV
jgi:hypothetical protein